MKKRILNYLRDHAQVVNVASRVSIVAVFAVVGSVLVYESHAATYSSSAEAEQGVLAGRAAKASSQEASNAAYVTFGAADSGLAPSLSDDFSGTALQPYWTFENPGGTSRYTTGTSLNLTVGANNDQWIGIDKAPRLLKASPSGNDWTIETDLTANTGGATSYAGLVVYKDAANWVGWAQVGNSGMEGSGIIGNTYTQPFTTAPGTFNHLRIRKLGSTFALDFSVNGTVWNNANTWVDTSGALNGARVGLLAKNWGSTEYSVTAARYREYAGDAMPSALADTAQTTQVTKETGFDGLNDTHAANFCGADLGEMFHWNNKIYTVFGDTNRCNGGAWPSNVMSYTTDTTPANGITYDGWVGGGSELFPEDPGNVTAIPTNGVGVGSNGYIYYMDVNNWSPPAPTKWTCSQSSIASAVSANAAAWTKHPGTISWGGASNFGVDAVWQDGNTLYVWGDPCGRFGAVKLMKVDVGSILDKSAYQYLSGYDTNGSPVWSSNESAAVTVIGAPAGEISVMYNRWLGRYVITYLDERKAAIVIRESPTPWGSWSAPVTIASAGTYPALYNAFMDPSYVGNDGQDIYYNMSMFGPYNVYWMKTTLTKR